MTAEHLRKLRNADPFEPFCICMSDGQHIEINQPELIAISPCDDTVALFHDDGEFSILKIPHIKDVLVGTVAATPPQ